MTLTKALLALYCSLPNQEWTLAYSVTVTGSPQQQCNAHELWLL
jgi:hypothetical protein